MIDFLKKLRSRLKLDSHHAIERFGVVFGSLAVTGLIIFTATGVTSWKNTNNENLSTALYNNQFTTSKTQLQGKIPGIYVNKKKTRALVLMQFDDPTKISSNAKKYQGFITATDQKMNKQSLDEKLSGAIYSFGTTGYLGMVIESDRPFPSQILALTMRANAQLVFPDPANGNSHLSDELAGDKASAKYDQWRVFFNPGATGAITASSLDDGSLDNLATDQIFNNLVVSAQEKTAKEKLGNDLAQLKADLVKIQEYTDQAQRQNIGGVTMHVPAPPASIAGDEVIGTTSSTMELKTNHVIAGGYNFNWHKGSVAQGYLKNIVPKGQSFVQYLGNKANEVEPPMDTNALQFTLSDGTVLGATSTSQNTTLQPFITSMNNLTQAWSDYEQHKKQYEVNDYNDLINLDVELRSVESNSTVHPHGKALLVY